MKVEEKKLIVVLGMHRSGTSAITRALQVLGVSLGERLLPPVDGNNAKGFFEDNEINALNIEMLAAIESNWFYLAPIEASDVEKLYSSGYFLRAVELIKEKIFSTQIFAFKDPRVAKLLPFWKEVFEHCQLNVNYVIALRHPLSVVKSLAKRDGFAAEHSYLLWLGHVLESLIGSTGRPRLVVDYDLLLKSPDNELTRIALEFNLKIDPVELKSYKTDFLDQGLRHTTYVSSDLLLDGACPAVIREVYRALLSAACNQISLEDKSFLSEISLWIDEFERLKTSLHLADKLLFRTVIATKNESELGRQIVHLNDVVAERDGQIAHQIAGLEAYRTQAVAFGSQVKALQSELTASQSHIAHQAGELGALNAVRANELASTRFLSRRLMALVVEKMARVFKQQ
jgi:hypothetical protein